MKRLLSTLFCTALLAVGLIAKADTSSPVGLWETIDDATKKPKSHVRIYEQNGMLYGKIETLINPSEPNPVCKECKGDLKDKPITGMVIMNNMKPEDGGWEGGKILDPKNGKEYGCKLKLADGGKKLDVRGFLGFSLFGRTQTWNRIE